MARIVRKKTVNPDGSKTKTTTIRRGKTTVTRTKTKGAGEKRKTTTVARGGNGATISTTKNKRKGRTQKVRSVTQPSGSQVTRTTTKGGGGKKKDVRKNGVRVRAKARGNRR